MLELPEKVEEILKNTDLIKEFAVKASTEKRFILLRKRYGLWSCNGRIIKT